MPTAATTATVGPSAGAATAGSVKVAYRAPSLPLYSSTLSPAELVPAGSCTSTNSSVSAPALS